MTPGARVQAAIEVLDMILGGTPADKALTGWGRSHRFAGSKDRAAIRDHVFQALRCKRSYGWLGGADTGRGIMLGAMRAAGNIDDVFSGIGHAPSPMRADEAEGAIEDAPRGVTLDCPDWLLPHFDHGCGQQADEALRALQCRAPVFLRVNARKASPDEAAQVLAEDGIEAVFMQNLQNALQVIGNERKIMQSEAYLSGLVELQDASSQQAIEALDLQAGLRVLDYCAGGGGKALAMAAVSGVEVVAHDIDPKRMVDLPKRAARAGVEIRQVTTAALGAEPPFDLVFCDAPCSGSGTWRRTPQAKWDLSSDRLDALCAMQRDVLAQAAPLVGSGGLLCYATCSVFDVENERQIAEFMADRSGVVVEGGFLRMPDIEGDGFYLKVLRLTE